MRNYEMIGLLNILDYPSKFINVNALLNDILITAYSRLSVLIGSGFGPILRTKKTVLLSVLRGAFN